MINPGQSESNDTGGDEDASKLTFIVLVLVRLCYRSLINQFHAELIVAVRQRFEEVWGNAGREWSREEGEGDVGRGGGEVGSESCWD